MREYVRLYLALLMVVFGSCDLNHAATSSKHEQSSNGKLVMHPTENRRETRRVLPVDKPTHMHWRSPIYRTHGITTPRPFPPLPGNDYLGIYYEPADTYRDPIYLLKPYFFPHIYMPPPHNQLAINADIPKAEIRKEQKSGATVHRRDQSDVAKTDGNVFKDSLFRTREFLDLSVDGIKSDDAPGVARTRTADIDEVENVFMNCMDLQLAYMRLQPDNNEHLQSKIPRNEARTASFRTASELMNEIKINCKDPEKTIQSNVNDIMEASKVKRGEEMLESDIVQSNVGFGGLDRLNGETTGSETGEASYKNDNNNVVATDDIDKIYETPNVSYFDAKSIKKFTDIGFETTEPTHTETKSKEIILNYDYAHLVTTELSKSGPKSNVTLINTAGEIDPTVIKNATATKNQITSSSHFRDYHEDSSTSDSIDTIANYNNNGTKTMVPSRFSDTTPAEVNQSSVAQNIRFRINEANVKIPTLEKHELSNGSVISMPMNFEKLPNTDFIAQKDIEVAPSKSQLFKVLTGRMIFLHNNTKIPLRLQQNFGGSIDLAVDGNYLCDRLKYSPDNSIILAALCKVSD